jgi:hypothetical protein
MPAPVPPPPRGQAPAPIAPSDSNSTRHRHLGGFIRPDVGFGYLATNANGGSELGGVAGTIGFAAGGALSEDVIMAFHVWDAAASNPSYSNGSTLNGSLALFGLGGELTLYSKEDYYVSMSPSITRLTTVSGSSSSDTNWGFGLRFAVGKEWWVSDHWALGLVGHASMSLNSDSAGNNWRTAAVTMAFSATFN